MPRRRLHRSLCGSAFGHVGHEAGPHGMDIERPTAFITLGNARHSMAWSIRVDFQTTVDCTSETFLATFQVPSLHPDCFDTEEMHGTWTIEDPGQLCTSCCCARSALVVNPGGQCCASLADPDGTVPLTTILWTDFLLLGTCHLESVAFYVIGPNRDCETCDICNTCDSFSEVMGLLRWVVEQLPGTQPATCLVRASLVGVADCPRTWVVYELDNITQQQCAGTANLTLSKVAESVPDTFDCTFPDEITFQND
jgi:hypothetical protein